VSAVPARPAAYIRVEDATTAEQIALATGEFHTGRYVRDQETVSTCRWRRADA